MKDIVKRRWRLTLGKHLSLILEHFDRFLRGRGQVNHFNKFDHLLMQETLDLMRAIESYNRNYAEWLSRNVSNPEKFMPLRELKNSWASLREEDQVGLGF